MAAYHCCVLFWVVTLLLPKPQSIPVSNGCAHLRSTAGMTLWRGFCNRDILGSPHHLCGATVLGVLFLWMLKPETCVHSERNEIGARISAVDLEAFRNLVDPEEERYSTRESACVRFPRLATRAA